MAGVDIGSGEAKRSVNSELNMVPFIDLLFVTIAFLLITAVWVSHARIPADAMIPGGGEGRVVAEPAKVLHVHLGEGEGEVRLVWKLDRTVISETRAKKAGLAEAVRREWGEQGGHRDPADRKFDEAVLHVDDRASYREIVALLDAVASPKRPLRLPDGREILVPALHAALAAK